jgi:hypothetical protein
VASKFRRAVEQEKPWAILAALRNLAGYKWDQYGKTAVPAFANNDDDGDPVIKIKFEMPDPQPAIDVTPPQPTAYPPDSKPNYSVPAIEGPRPRVQTDSGAIYEQPRGSIFDRPGGTDWMK